MKIMLNLSLKFKLQTLVLIMVASSLACQKTETVEKVILSNAKTSVTQNGADQTVGEEQNSGGGGIDGSGGDLTKSTESDTRAAIESVLARLEGILEFMLSQIPNDETLADYFIEPGAYKIFSRFYLNSLEISESTVNPLIAALKKKQIRFVVQSDSCAVDSGVHAGRATGSLDEGEICLSLLDIKKTNRNSLNQEIFGLIIHELSHLVEFNEEDAQRIQNLVVNHPKLWIDASFEDLIIQKNCSTKDIDEEIKQIQNSPYWQNQIQKLLSLVDGQAPTSCTQDTYESKLVLIAKNLHYLDNTYFSHFSNNDFSAGIQSNAIEERFFNIYNGNSSTKINNYVFQIATQNEILKIYPTRKDTKSQCSPKAGIAHLIANIPDLINASCVNNLDGLISNESIKKRILIEQNILSQEK